jgi:hypothetical protein
VTAHTFTLTAICCNKCGCKVEGSQDETAADIREWLAGVGWDISDDGDWCPDHKGIPMSIRGRRAIERAECERRPSPGYGQSPEEVADIINKTGI